MGGDKLSAVKPSLSHTPREGTAQRLAERRDSMNRNNTTGTHKPAPPESKPEARGAAETGISKPCHAALQKARAQASRKRGKNRDLELKACRGNTNSNLHPHPTQSSKNWKPKAKAVGTRIAQTHGQNNLFKNVY